MFQPQFSDNLVRWGISRNRIPLRDVYPRSQLSWLGALDKVCPPIYLFEPKVGSRVGMKNGWHTEYPQHDHCHRLAQQMLYWCGWQTFSYYIQHAHLSASQRSLAHLPPRRSNPQGWKCHRRCMYSLPKILLSPRFRLSKQVKLIQITNRAYLTQCIDNHQTSRLR